MICTVCRRRPSDYDDRNLCVECSDGLSDERERDEAVVAVPSGLLDRFVDYCRGQGWRSLSWSTWCDEAARWVDDNFGELDDGERSELVAWLSDEWRQP